VLIRAQKASLLDAANYSTIGLTVAALTDCPVRLFLEKLTVAQLVNKSPTFYEPEDSLPPHVAFVSELNHAHSLSLRSTSMFPIYVLFFQVVSLLQISFPKCIHFSTPHIFHIYNLLFLFITTTNSYLGDDRIVSVGFHMLLLPRTTTA
jgi:hypothetical protein